MPAPKKTFDESRVDFSKMTFSPDVPSGSLAINEYNSGINVETDIRGIRSAAGDQILLPSIPGTPTFVSGGFRHPIPGYESDFWFLVATTEGYWYACNGQGEWIDVTPVKGPFATYTQATNITEAWNGTVPFYNDESNPPMFWSEFQGVSFPLLTASGDGSTVTLTFDNQADEITGVNIAGHQGEFTYTNAAPLKVGQKVTVSGTTTSYNDFGLPRVTAVDLNGSFTCENLLAPAFFTGSITGTTMTVTAVASGSIINGAYITGAGVEDGTQVIGFAPGTSWGVGTYYLNKSQTVPSGSLRAQRSEGLFVGQTVTLQNTPSDPNRVLNNVKITSSNGDISFNPVFSGTKISAGSVVEITGSITNVPTLLSSVSIDSISGDFSCAATTLALGQTVTIAGTVTNTDTVLSSVACVGSLGQFQCAPTSLQVGQVVRVEGVASTSPINLSSVQITGTGGQFSCAAAPLYVGQIVQISGTLSGTGSITGYTNPTIYKIGATSSGSTDFTLVSLTDEAIVTTAGTTTGLDFTIAPQSLTNYTNPTEYEISATNGSTTFTLRNLNGSALITTGGAVDPLTFTVLAPEIVDYTNPTEYVIVATNGSNTFTLATTEGEPIVTHGGIPAGLTYTIVIPSITDYVSGNQYIVGATNGSTTAKLYTIVTDPLTGLLVPGSALQTHGGQPTGLTFTWLKPEVLSYVAPGPQDYYVGSTNGTTQFTLVDGNGDPIQTHGGQFNPTLLWRVQHARIVGFSDPSTYYIIATNGTNNFQLSATYGGSPIQTYAGPYAYANKVFIFTPFGVGESISVVGTVPTAYRGNYTVTDVGSDFVQFASSASGDLVVNGAVSDPMPRLTMYSNKLPIEIYDIVYNSFNTMQIILASTQTEPPYIEGEEIIISGVNSAFNGVYRVKSSTVDTIEYYATPASNFPPGVSGAMVAPKYAWNYNPNWKSVYAKWMRLYNTPNVGCILVAGGLTATDLDGTVFEYPVTVQWSQAFGLNDAPLTWQPTVTNVANQLEVPLRGQALDAFPANGQLFICSYWDTIVLSPLNYTSTSAPILGVRLVNQGRGILSSNCWTNTDTVVYGVDARDIWAFDGNNFKGIANQRVKNWFYDQIDQDYVDRIFMDTNTAKNQVEIYYPTRPPVISSIVVDGTDGWFTCVPLTQLGGPLRNGIEVRLNGTQTSGTGSITGYTGATKSYWVVDTNGVDRFQLSETPTGDAVTTTAGTMIGVNFEFFSDGVPNMMLSYRYDLDVWNAPREVQSATMTCEAPFWDSQQWYHYTSGTTLTGVGSGARFEILREATKYDGFPTPNVRGQNYAVGDTILVTGDKLGGETPANDAVITVTETNDNGRIVDFTIEGNPLDNWRYEPGKRTIVYARGLENRNLVMKDYGYNFLGPQLREYNINSRFTRDNIKILPDYSGKLLVHRVLPEIYNLNKYNLPIDTLSEARLIGTVDFAVSGSESVGQPAVETTSTALSTDTSKPWVQINQNAHRVNSLTISGSSQDQIWICNGTSWQYTQTEDDR